MRTRVVSSLVLLALPVVLSAQVVRRPTTARRPTPIPAPLPPTAGPVARALDYHRSRWSAEGYGLISAMRLPGASGIESYGAFGTGSHAGYRIADRFSAGVDLTTSLFNSAFEMQTAEAGGRFSPLPFNTQIRPFLDVRAMYLRTYD